jgi:transposase
MEFEKEAQLAGVPVVIINPAYTSKMCPKCTAIDDKNRKTQSEFCCTGCNYTEHADVVGATNIASAGAASISLLSSANLLQKAS